MTKTTPTDTAAWHAVQWRLSSLGLPAGQYHDRCLEYAVRKLHAVIVQDNDGHYGVFHPDWTLHDCIKAMRS